MIRITTDIPKHLISTIITSNIDENLENEALEYNDIAKLSKLSLSALATQSRMR